MFVTWHWCNNTLSTFDHNSVVLLQTSSLGNPFIEVNVHLVLIIMKRISMLLVVSRFLSLFICTDVINLTIIIVVVHFFSLGSFFSELVRASDISRGHGPAKFNAIGTSVQLALMGGKGLNHSTEDVSHQPVRKQVGFQRNSTNKFHVYSSQKHNRWWLCAKRQQSDKLMENCNFILKWFHKLFTVNHNHERITTHNSIWQMV